MRRHNGSSDDMIRELYVRVDEAIDRLRPSPFRFRIGTRNPRRWQREPDPRLVGKHAPKKPCFEGQMGYAADLARSGIDFTGPARLEFERVNGGCP